jgi:hypothetical protein
MTSVQDPIRLRAGEDCLDLQRYAITHWLDRNLIEAGRVFPERTELTRG